MSFDERALALAGELRHEEPGPRWVWLDGPAWFLAPAAFAFAAALVVFVWTLFLPSPRFEAPAAEQPALERGAGAIASSSRNVSRN